MPARFGESGGISLLGSGSVGSSGEVKKPLHTLAMIVFAAVGLVIVLIALPSLVHNAQEIANSIKTYKRIPRN